MGPTRRDPFGSVVSFLPRGRGHLVHVTGRGDLVELDTRGSMQRAGGGHTHTLKGSKVILSMEGRNSYQVFN